MGQTETFFNESIMHGTAVLLYINVRGIHHAQMTA